MSHGPYIETADSPRVVAEPGALGPREKVIPRRTDGSRVPGWDTPNDLSKAPAIIPDLATTPVPDHLVEEIRSYLTRYPDPRSAIIPALWAAQRLHGWCSPLAIQQVGAVLHRTPAELMAVATFYDQFETEPVGKSTIYVCTNISCSLRGADALLHRFEHESAGREDEFHVRGFECLGACDIAPMVSIDGLFIGPIDLDEVGGILEAVAAGRTETIFPERQMNNRASVDPGAQEIPAHDEDGPSGAAASEVGDATPDEAGATAEADPRRQSSTTQPSSDPDNDDATTERATGQDPEEDTP